jgi:aminomethyltransferase
MGVAEMTRFGMEPEDFGELARLMRDVVVKQKDVKEEVASFRKRFRAMRYCFAAGDCDDFIAKLHRLI